MATVNRTVNHISGERWLPLAGAGGWYSVSDIGRVRRNPVTAIGKDGRRLAFSESLMGQQSDPDGYKQIKFSRLCPYPRKQPLVHRLVFETFARPIGDGEEINHINGIKWDNRVCNLEAVPHLANMQHAMRLGLSPIGERIGRSILTAEQVRAIAAMRSAGMDVRRVANAFGVSGPTVSNIMAGRCWRSVTGLTRHWVRTRRAGTAQ